MMTLRKLIILQLFLTIFTLSYLPPVWAEKASGEFTAQQTCPAFISRNKSTNPDNARVQPGYKYSIIEVSAISNPGWYRVIVPTVSPEKR